MPVNSTDPDYDMRLPAWSRALKLVHVLDPDTGLGRCRYVVQVWRGQASEDRRKKSEWVLVEERTPLRLGQPLEHIPFVSHRPNHSLPHVDKLLLGDLIAANLDHYRLNPDYKHGMHYTALPTAYFTGCLHVAAFVKTRSSGMPSPRAPGFLHRFYLVFAPPLPFSPSTSPARAQAARQITTNYDKRRQNTTSASPRNAGTVKPRPLLSCNLAGEGSYSYGKPLIQKCHEAPTHASSLAGSRNASRAALQRAAAR